MPRPHPLDVCIRVLPSRHAPDDACLCFGCVADLYARTSSYCQSIVSPSCLSFSHAIDYVLAAGDLINCGAMAGGKKCVELTAIACERKRMRAFFGSAASEPLHRLRVEYVNFAWAADGDGEMCVHAMARHLQ